MKKFLSLILLILAGATMVVAQEATTEKKSDNDEIKTLFHKGSGNAVKPELGWYVGPTAAWTQISGKNTFMPGIEGGLIINHYFSVGVAGSITANVNNLYFKDVVDTLDANFVGGYAGVKMEFTFFPTFPVHFSIPVLIGGGASAYLHRYNYDSDWYNYNGHNNYWDCEVLDWNSFFVLEPGIRAEINIVKFMRFWIGGTYRWAPGYNLVNTPNNFMSNFNLNAGLKFGKF